MVAKSAHSVLGRGGDDRASDADRGLIGGVFPTANFFCLSPHAMWKAGGVELHLFSSVGIFLLVAAPWAHYGQRAREPVFWSYFINEIKTRHGTRFLPRLRSCAVVLGLART